MDLASYPGASRFRTRLREGAAKGPNFAGHFTVVTWGCGSSCQEHAIVDAQTGKVAFPIPRPTSNGLCFRLDSNLIITVPVAPGTLGEWEPSFPDWLVTRYYKWDGKQVVELFSTWKQEVNTRAAQ